MEPVLEDLEQLHAPAKSRINAGRAGAMPLWTPLPTGLTLSMKKRDVNIPEIGLIAATRAMLGAGVALLSATSFPPSSAARSVGPVAVGVLTTFPIALDGFGHDAARAEGHEPCDLGV